MKRILLAFWGMVLFATLGTTAANAAIFAQDTFSTSAPTADQGLSARVPTTGAAWSISTSHFSDMTIGPGGGTGAVFVLNAGGPYADLIGTQANTVSTVLSSDFVCKTAPSNFDKPVWILKANGTGANTSTFEYASYEPVNSKFVVGVYNGGAFNSINTETGTTSYSTLNTTAGTNESGTTLAVGTHHIKVTAVWNGTNETISAYLDNSSTPIATGVDTTTTNTYQSTITGYAGLGDNMTSGSATLLSTDTTGINILNITVQDLISNAIKPNKPNLPAGHAGNLVLTITATGTTAFTYPSSTQFTFSGTGGYTVVSQATTSTTAATVTITTSATTGTFIITNSGTGGDNTTTTLTIATPVATITPAYSPLATGATTVTYTETVNGVPDAFLVEDAPTLISSATTVDTVGTYAAYSDTAGTFTFTQTPVAVGTTNFTNSADNAPAVSFIVSTPLVIPVNASNVLFSPYNWSNNSGVYYTNNVGAYFKITVTLTTPSAMTITSDLTSVAGSPYPQIYYSVAPAGNSTVPAANTNLFGKSAAGFVANISDGTMITAGTTAASGQIATVFSGTNSGNTMPPGTYNIFLQCTWLNYFSSNNIRWSCTSTTKPTSNWTPTSVTFSGGGTSAIPTALPHNVMILGDSISIGANDLGPNVTTGDGSVSFPNEIGPALNAEYGIRGFGGSAYASGSGEGVPAWYSSMSTTTLQPWNAYDAGHSMLTAGKFSPVPDYIVDTLGTNDFLVSNSTTTVQADIGTATTGLLPALLSASGTSTKILEVSNPGDFLTSLKQAAVSAVGNANVIFDSWTNAGLTALTGLNISSGNLVGGTWNNGGSQDSWDHIHPSVRTQSKLGSMYTAMIKHALGATSTTVYFGRRPIQ